MTDFTEFPIPTEVVEIQETPKAAALPRARAAAPHIARGWIDPVAAVPPGSVLTIPDYLPTPAGWWDFGEAHEGLRPICNWTPEALRTGNTVVQDFVIDPTTLFTDVDGLIPAAAPGATIAALRDSQGRIIATQATSAARQKFGRHPASGLRNRLPNNRGDGAVVGVVGSGGSLPTGVAAYGTTGLTLEVLSVTALNGLPRFRLRISGTPSNNFGLLFNSAATVLATVGQVWTPSVFLALAAGDFTNIPQVRLGVTQRDVSNAVIGDLIGSDIKGGVTASASRFQSTFTLNAATVANISKNARFDWTSGAIDITLDISASQFEQAAEATAVQITGASGFDITEAGQRDVYYLAPDGVDDWMALVSAFTPAGAYTAAAMADIQSDAIIKHFFGKASGSAARFFRNTSNGLELQADGALNRTVYGTSGFSAAATGRSVQIVRAANTAAPADGFVNGIGPLASTPAGNMQPLTGGFDSLFRHLTSFTAPRRFYGGVLIDRAISEPERLMLQLYLASKGGIAL